MKIPETLYRFRWPLVVVLFLAALLWVFGYAFGEQLGIDPGARAMIGKTATAIWGGIVTLLAPVIARDNDHNGIPDILEGGPDA